MILVGDMNTSSSAIDCYPGSRNINMTKLLHHNVNTDDDNNDIKEAIKNIQEVKLLSSSLSSLSLPLI